MTDKPVAALIIDLKTRGMLEDTLVVWGGESGRTPVAQGSDGLDHNSQRGFLPKVSHPTNLPNPTPHAWGTGEGKPRNSIDFMTLDSDYYGRCVTYSNSHRRICNANRLLKTQWKEL